MRKLFRILAAASAPALIAGTVIGTTQNVSYARSTPERFLTTKFKDKNRLEITDSNSFRLTKENSDIEAFYRFDKNGALTIQPRQLYPELSDEQYREISSLKTLMKVQDTVCNMAQTAYTDLSEAPYLALHLSQEEISRIINLNERCVTHNKITGTGLYDAASDPQ